MGTDLLSGSLTRASHHVEDWLWYSPLERILLSMMNPSGLPVNGALDRERKFWVVQIQGGFYGRTTEVDAASSYGLQQNDVAFSLRGGAERTGLFGVEYEPFCCR
jgi:hypothetical protein